jgi:hypothetical protein
MGTGCFLERNFLMKERLFDRSRYHLLKQAVDALAAVCDGAHRRDTVGYNGIDARYGHLLAFLSLEEWPPEAFYRAWKMLRKYSRQLASADIDYARLPEPPNYDGEDRQITFNEATGDFVVVFSYDPLLLEEFRSVPGNDFVNQPVPHRLVHPVKGAEAALLAFAQTHAFVLGKGTRERLQRYRVELEDGQLALFFPFDRTLNEEVKAIPGWSTTRSGGFHWLIPLSQFSAVQALVARHSQFIVAANVEKECFS